MNGSELQVLLPCDLAPRSASLYAWNKIWCAGAAEGLRKVGVQV